MVNELGVPYYALTVTVDEFTDPATKKPMPLTHQLLTLKGIAKYRGSSPVTEPSPSAVKIFKLPPFRQLNSSAEKQ
jgi:hypothetical protein